MIHEFSRTQLLTGAAGLDRLRNSAVLVFGVGGVGSHCIEAASAGSSSWTLTGSPSPT